MRATLAPLLAFLLAALLAGCGINTELDAFDAEVGFQPTSLGFEVDDEGKIEITSHVVTFNVAPGSVGGVVTGYDVAFFDNLGEPFIGSVDEENPQEVEDHEFTVRDSMSQRLPPGRVCTGAGEQPPSDPCRASSPDVTYQWVTADPISNVVTLPGLVASELVSRADTNGDGLMDSFDEIAGYAEFTFYVRTDNGRVVTLPTQRVGFTFPVTGGE
ncbi:MAG: hypothetical protein U5K81_04680 [Trueperaceae bacterium]|nr:hypothetical protein [Trueperaceae bacterium]